MSVYIVTYYNAGSEGVDSVHRSELSALTRAKELEHFGEVVTLIVERELIE